MEDNGIIMTQSIKTLKSDALTVVLADTITELSTPKIASISYPGNDTAANPAGGQTITLTGANFAAGVQIFFNNITASVVSFINSSTVTFVSPAMSVGSYVLYVINADGGTGILVPGIQYSGTPVWTTAAGSLGSVYETTSISNTLQATGDAPITYTLLSGTLPPGATLNSNGTVSGTSSTTASSTTYTFTIRATDAENQDTDRTFSLTINPDVITWVNPTAGATINADKDTLISNVVLNATSAAAATVAYTADSLPTGLTLSNGIISGTPTVIANTSTLLTATANTTSESSSITINWSVSVASDPYFMYNSLLLSGNGTNGAQNNTFLDGSTNNFTITRNGNTTQGTFSPYGPNWSNFFDGAGDYLDTVSASSQFAFGTGDFTVEFWIKTTASTFNIINPTSATGSGYWGLLFSAGNFYWNDSYNVTYNILVNATSILNDAWHHVAICRTSGSSKVYFDGVSQITQADSTNYSGVSTWRIGSGNVGAYLGYLSNLRVVKGTAVYASNFTPSTTPLTAISGTSLLTCQSNRFIDNSTNNFTITRNGEVSIQRFSPFSPGAVYSTSTIGGSGYLSGASSTWLAVPINATFAFGTNNYTYEAWVYPTAFTNAYNTIFCNFRDDEGAKGWSLLITSTGLIHVNNQGTYNNSTNALSLNTWTHIAVCRVGNTVTRYINGVADPTTLTVTASITNVAAQGPTIGGSPEYSTAREWTGYISNARVVSGTALYTSNFTPSTTPFTAVSGTSLLLNYTNAGIIDNTMINNLETVGNAQISSAQTKFGSGSMSFDGTGDYLTTPLLPNLQFGTGNFTVECWNYMIARTNTVPAIFSNYNNYTTGALCLFAGHSSGTTTSYQVAINGASFPAIQGGTIAYNTWVHLAVVRYNGIISLYVNGTSVGTPYSTAVTLNGVGSLFYIGSTGDSLATGYINGYIDDLRITKGYARYTSNFTPPTAAFVAR